MNGREIKAVMAKHNDTQEKLAEFLGIQTSGVSARINGKIEFRRSEINAIRQRYGLTDQETIAIFFDEAVS